MAALYVRRRNRQGAALAKTALESVANQLERDCRGAGAGRVCDQLRELAAGLPADPAPSPNEAAATADAKS